MEYRSLAIKMVLRLGPPLLILISFLALVAGLLYHAVYLDESIYKSPPRKHFDTNVIIDNQPGDLLWFMQLTDLHINTDAQDREKDFEEFAKTYVDIIKPQAVLVTGDITDGRFPNSTLGSGPQLYDWSTYSSIITNRTDASKKTVWLDIRGNHDNFNVYNPQDPKNLYRQYSIQGKTHPRNQFNLVVKNGKNYTFIGVDEIQSPGLKVPFNFLGVVDSDDINILNKYKQRSKEAESQYTIWYGHYPTSSIESRVSNLKEMIDGPYLCGHYHTIGHLVENMYANQQTGYSEIELGDWKNGRYLRLAAVDHQLFSFVDVKYKQWPIALMTNPKNAHNRMPKYEPLERMLNSTHVRVLAFSNVTITSVEVSLAGQEFKLMENVEGPLYVLKTDFSQYSDGIVSASIKVVDQSRSIQIYNQTFSLSDQLGPETPLLSRLFLRLRFRLFMMSVFLFLVTVCVLPILCMKLTVSNDENSFMNLYYKDEFLYNIYMLSKINKIVYPLLFIPLYMAIGPQFFGKLVDDVIGTCFVWGIIIEGRFMYTGITYNASSLFLLTVHIPNTLLVAWELGDRYKALNRPDRAFCSFAIKLLLYAIVTLIQLSFGLILISAYGILAYSTSFLYLWSLLIYIHCWIQTRNVTRKDFKMIQETDHGNPLQEKLLTNPQANA